MLREKLLMKRSISRLRGAKMEEKKKKELTKSDKIKNIVGIVLCVIFGFVLICNLTIIIKGSVNPDNPPSVFSVTPLVVLSGSMSGEDDGHIEIGDLIFIKDVNYADLKEGDVVTYKDGKSFTTHRIIGQDEKGFITKGDANNAEDTKRLTEDRLVGIVTGRVPKIGNFALFLQTPLGMVLFVGLPLLAFIVYDLIKRQMQANKEGDKTKALEEELARLRAAAAANSSTAGGPPSPDGEGSSSTAGGPPSPDGEGNSSTAEAPKEETPANSSTAEEKPVEEASETEAE